MKSNTKLTKIIPKAGAVLLALIIWQAVSMLVGMDMLLASPMKVTVRLFSLISEPDFILTVLTSLLRIMLGFSAAFVLGILSAFLAGRFHIAETLLWPYIVTFKTVPVASFIILCLIWFSYSQLTVFISFLIAFPVIYSNVLQGIKSTDKNLLEMAEIYKISWNKKLLYILIPAVRPYIISASSVSVGMAWKAGVAAEVIGVVNGTIGEKLYDAKIYFQNADLLAWTIVIIILSVLMEKLFVFILRLAYKGVEKL